MLPLSRPSADRPARCRSRRSLRETLINTGVAARAALFVVFGVIALSLSAPQSAKALFDTCDWTAQSINQMADNPGAAENIFPAVKQWDSKRELVSGATPLSGSPTDYTVYELGALRGLNWAATQQSQEQAKQTEKGAAAGEAADNDDCSIQNEIYNSIAQMVFDLSKFITRASISIKEISSNPSPLAALYEGTVEGDNSVVDRLNDNVFKLAVPTMILLTGLWVFGKWRKGDMREVWSGVGWAAFVVIAVSAFLVDNNYTRVVETADSGIAQGNAALTEAVLGGAVDDIDPPCDLAANAPQRGMRISSCAMYDTLAFRPWAIGQFGDPGKQRIEYKGTAACDFGSANGKRCTDLRVRQVMAQSITNFDYYKESKTDGGVMKDKENQYGELRNYIATKHSARFYEQWSGDKPGNRITMGIYALVASLIVGIMVVVLSALTLLWHAVTLIMIILLPLVAIISIHPTQQKLLRGWWQTFVHSFVLRAGFGVILTVLLLFYQLILPLSVPLGMQLLMLLLVTVSVVMLLKNLLSGKFSPQVAGAEDALGVGDAANATFNKAAAMAPGLAVSTARTAGDVGRTTGRVAGTAAKGTARVTGKGLAGAFWAVDKRRNNGELRDKLQRGGWIGQSKREQRQAAYWAAKNSRGQEERPAEGNVGGTPPQDPEGQSPAAPRRTGRVSGSSGTQTPQPAPTPTPASPAPRPQPASPQPAPADPQPPASPAPRPRDPRDPSGRV